MRKHGEEWRGATAASCPGEVVTKAEARRVKPGGFGAVPLGFATDAPRGGAESFTLPSNNARKLEIGKFIIMF